jgi:hypothetical protein
MLVNNNAIFRHQINSNGPLNAQDARFAERAQQMREKARSVVTDLTAVPSDRVSLADTAAAGVHLQSNVYSGNIGSDGYSNATAVLKRGKVLSFTASDCATEPATKLKYMAQSSEATGTRAALAGAVGALGTGMLMLAFSVQRAAHAVGFSPEASARLSSPLAPLVGALQSGHSKLSTTGAPARESVTLEGPTGRRESYEFLPNGTIAVLLDPGSVS